MTAPDLHSAADRLFVVQATLRAAANATARRGEVPDLRPVLTELAAILGSLRPPPVGRPPRPGRTKLATLMLDPDVLAEMQAEAARQDRNISWVVVEAVAIAMGEIKTGPTAKRRSVDG